MIDQPAIEPAGAAMRPEYIYIYIFIYISLFNVNSLRDT
jgi:hypothetical protein